MPYVIEKETGRQRWVGTDLLQRALDSGAYSLQENQTILMDSGDGTSAQVESEDYEDVIKAGGRALSTAEAITVREDIAKEAYYSTPDQRLKAGALGAARGISLDASDVLLEGGAPIELPWGMGSIDRPSIVSEEERKELERFRPVESMAGEILGMGVGIVGSGGTGLAAKGAAVTAKGAAAGALGRMGRTVGPLVKWTPAGLAGTAGRAAGAKTAKIIAGKIGAKGLAKNQKALAALASAAPVVASGITEEAIIAGAQAAAEFDYTGNADDLVATLWASGQGGAIGGGISATLAALPGSSGMALALWKKGFKIPPKMNRWSAEKLQKLTGEYSEADASKVAKIFEGKEATPEMVLDALKKDDIIKTEDATNLAAALNEIVRTGPRQINNTFFDAANGVRKQTVDQILPGTKGFEDLKGDFDAIGFQASYQGHLHDLEDIAFNPGKYTSENLLGAADETLNPLAARLKALAGHDTMRGSPETFNKIARQIAFQSRKAAKRLRRVEFYQSVKAPATNLLRQNVSLPGHLADVLVEANEGIRNIIYTAVEKGGMRLDDWGMLGPTREYFQGTLTNPQFLGAAAKFYSKTSNIYTRWSKVKNETRKYLEKHGLLDAPAEKIKDLIDRAEKGDKKALEAISKYKKLSEATDAYTQEVLAATKQSPALYQETITRNIKAYNSLEGSEQLAELVKIFAPSEQSHYVSGMVSGAKDLLKSKLLAISKKQAGAFLTLGALTSGSIPQMIGIAAGANLAGSALKAFRSPYKQLNRLARIEQLEKEGKEAFEDGVKSVINNIGKDGRFVIDAMEVTQSAANAYMADLLATYRENENSPAFGSREEKTDSRQRQTEKKAFLTITTLGSSPDLLHSKIEEATSDIDESPTIRDAIKRQTAESIQVINRIRPKEINIKMDPLTGEQSVSGPDYAFDKMNQIYAMAQNPIKVVIAASRSRTLTKGMADAFSALHPKIYADFVGKIRESIIDQKTRSKTKYSDRLMLSTLFNIPMEASITAPAMSALQAAYQEEEKPEPRPQRGLASLKKEVDNTMTPSQRAMTA